MIEQRSATTAQQIMLNFADATGVTSDRPPKRLNERTEWERDGQYYHYLTKWMHALDRVSQETGEPTFHRWAVELAKTAHDRFTYRLGATASGDSEKRMDWKMSIDLSHSLVGTATAVRHQREFSVMLATSLAPDGFLTA